MSRLEQEPQQFIPKGLIIGVGIAWIVIAAILDHLENPTLGRPIPTPIPTRQPILVPLSEGEKLCPDGSWPIRNKINAFCRQSQLTPKR